MFREPNLWMPLVRTLLGCSVDRDTKLYAVKTLLTLAVFPTLDRLLAESWLPGWIQQELLKAPYMMDFRWVECLCVSICSLFAHC